MKFEFSRQIFEKCSDFKFNENPSSGSGVFPCIRTYGRTDRQTDTTNLMITFWKFAYAPENVTPSWSLRWFAHQNSVLISYLHLHRVSGSSYSHVLRLPK